MCSYQIKLRGVRVCGRSVYRTDCGVKIGWRGPTVTLAAALADLSPLLAAAVEEAVRNVDATIAGSEIAAGMLVAEAAREAEEDAEEFVRSLILPGPDDTPRGPSNAS